MAPSHLELVPTKFCTRRSRPKLKLGCSTCLRRKIKCDEHFPNCHNCTKRKRYCGYRDIYEQANKDIFSLISEDDYNEACKWVIDSTKTSKTSNFASDTSSPATTATTTESSPTTTTTESSPTSTVTNANPTTTMTESSPTYTMPESSPMTTITTVSSPTTITTESNPITTMFESNPTYTMPEFSSMTTVSSPATTVSSPTTTVSTSPNYTTAEPNKSQVRETPTTSPWEIGDWDVDWCYVTQLIQKQ